MYPITYNLPHDKLTPTLSSQSFTVIITQTRAVIVYKIEIKILYLVL